MRHARLVTFTGQHWPVDPVVLVSATPMTDAEWYAWAAREAKEAERVAYLAQIEGGFTVGSVSVASVEEVEVKER